MAKVVNICPTCAWLDKQRDEAKRMQRGVDREQQKHITLTHPFQHNP